jgi:FkbM family methyltransferase
MGEALMSRRARLVVLANRVRRVQLGYPSKWLARTIDAADSRLRAKDYRRGVRARVDRQRRSPAFASTVSALRAHARFAALRDTPLGLYDVGARGGPPLTAYPFGGVLRLVLCEPDPAETGHLLAIEGFREVRVETRLIGARAGCASLKLTRKPGGSSILQPGVRTNDRHEVIREIALDMITLDQLQRACGVPCDALKIDVQGTDFEVLEGCSALPHCIRVEAATYESYLGQHLASDVYELLVGRGYVLISDSRKLTQKSYDDLLFSWWGRSETDLATTRDATAWLLSHMILGTIDAPGFTCPEAWAEHLADLKRILGLG